MGLFSFFKKKKKNEIEKAEAVSVKEAPKAEVKPELDAEPKNAETVEVSEAPAAQAAPEAKDNVKEAPEAKAAEKPKNASPKNQSAETKSKAKPAESENADKKSAAKAEKAEEEPVLKTKSEAAPKKEATKATAKKEAAKTDKKQPADAEPSAQPKAEEAAEANATGAEKITGRFEIKKAKDGRYVFNLYAANHVIVATSQVYSSSQSALVGINSVIANADKAPIEDQSLKSYETYGYPKWEIYVDKGGQYRFRLYAANGSCICHSQGYTSKTNCKNGIDSIIRSSRNAEIDKSYLKKEDK